MRVINSYAKKRNTNPMQLRLTSKRFKCCSQCWIERSKFTLAEPTQNLVSNSFHQRMWRRLEIPKRCEESAFWLLFRKIVKRTSPPPHDPTTTHSLGDFVISWYVLKRVRHPCRLDSAQTYEHVTKLQIMNRIRILVFSNCNCREKLNDVRKWRKGRRKVADAGTRWLNVVEEGWHEKTLCGCIFTSNILNTQLPQSLQQSSSSK